MKQCPGCHRHLRSPEPHCPFCGAEQRSGPDLTATGLVGSVVLSALLVACTERSPGDTTETTGTTPPATTSGTTTGVTPTTSGPGTSTGPDGTTTTATTLTDGSVSSNDPSLDTGDSGCAFYAGCPVDVASDHQFKCNPILQDCPVDEKCTAWGSEGWTGTKCVPVTGARAPGEPCTAPMGGNAGVDDCEAGAMCWDVDDNNQGTCVALCTGSYDDPMCAPAMTTCVITNNDVLTLCLPTCDPLVQGCPDDDLCIPAGDAFVCVFDGSGDTGAVNDPCEFQNGCDAGLFCLATPGASSVCMQNAGGCCQPFCDLTQMVPCPNPDQQCVPWFDPMEMEPPPGLEDVGICAIPPP